MAERRVLLEKRIPGIRRVLDFELDGVPTAHLYDVSALLWTSRRIFAKAATRIPDAPRVGLGGAAPRDRALAERLGLEPATRRS